MGYKELIDALKKEGEKQKQEIRDSAEKECERLRHEGEVRMRKLEERADEMIKRVQAEERRKIISKAEEEAKKIILQAEAGVLKRVYELAKRELRELRKNDYPEVFRGLAEELGVLNCEKVRVNPEDMELVREHFPDAVIESDDSISGGLEVFIEGGRIHLINTFEARFERAWEHLKTEVIENMRYVHDI